VKKQNLVIGLPWFSA